MSKTCLRAVARWAPRALWRILRIAIILFAAAAPGAPPPPPPPRPTTEQHANGDRRDEDAD